MHQLTMPSTTETIDRATLWPYGADRDEMVEIDGGQLRRLDDGGCALTVPHPYVREFPKRDLEGWQVVVTTSDGDHVHGEIEGHDEIFGCVRYNFTEFTAFTV